jgi:hypothetical protein
MIRVQMKCLDFWGVTGAVKLGMEAVKLGMDTFGGVGAGAEE